MYGLQLQIEIFKSLRAFAQSNTPASIRDIIEQIRTTNRLELDEREDRNLYNRVRSIITQLFESGYLSRFGEQTDKNITTYYYSVTNKITFINVRQQ